MIVMSFVAPDILVLNEAARPGVLLGEVHRLPFGGAYITVEGPMRRCRRENRYRDLPAGERSDAWPLIQSTEVVWR